MHCSACLPRSILALVFFTGSLILPAITQLQAQSNAVDPTFNGTGLSGTASLGLLGSVRGLGLQPDGKLLVLGGTPGLARLNADGTTDTSFVSAIKPTFTYDPMPIVVVQSDGKILVGGAFTRNDGSAATGIVRLNTDGSIDRGFDGSAVSSAYSVYALALQSDGKILVGGFPATQSKTGLIRLNTDGSIDSTFTAKLSYADAAVLQKNDKVIADTEMGLVRLDANGAVDATFQPPAGTSAFQLGLQSDGKVIVGDSDGLIRLNTDGSADSTFNFTGSILSTFLTVEPDNGILVQTYTDSRNEAFPITRLSPDGSVDTAFHAAADSTIKALVVAPDNTIFVGGAFTGIKGFSCNSVAKLGKEGAVDKMYTVDVTSGPNGPVSCVAVGSDGKVVIAGSFTQVDGVSHPGLARLTSTGTVDASFSATLENDTNSADPISALAVQADGKILLYGGFTDIDGVAAPGYARLNANGTLDTTLNIAPLTSLSQLFVQPDGKIVLGGSATDGNGNAQAAIAQLNPDDSVNPALTILPAGDSALAVQPDGKVLAEYAFNLVRVNADGTPDTSFNATTPIGGHLKYIYCIVVQPNGQILVGGTEISVFSNQPGLGILLRYNTDGTLDGSFQGGSLDGAVTFIVAAADGSLTIGGTFSEVAGQPRQGLAHLSADGTLDPFLPGEPGVSGSVNALAAQANGKVVLGGNFTSVDGVPRNYVARLSNGGTPDFFAGGVPVGSGFYYLQFASGTPFGYYNLAGDGYTFPYFFHADLGLEYFFDANDGQGGAYLYDFTSNTFFYTSPVFSFPYLYDFTLNTVLYYYPDPNNAGHYNTDGIRYFYDFNAGQIITK